ATGISAGFAALLVTQRSRRLFCSRHEISMLQSQVKPGIRLIPLKKGQRLTDAIGVINGPLGINATSLSYSTARAIQRSCKARLMDISAELALQREVKTREEIALIARSCAIASRIVGEAMRRAKGRTERELARFLVERAQELADGTSFDPIVASGPNGANPHHLPSARKLHGMVVLDFGVRHKGYCSDITRTFCVGRQPTGKEREAYDRVLAAELAGVRECVAGNNASKVVTEAVEQLGDMAPYFIHRIGHSVGVEIHDPSRTQLLEDSKDLLQANSTFTVEPGVYFPSRFGIRIEDTVLIGERPKRLTTVGRELVVVR
ncbi:hypothetical protein COV94_04125, partial [Candidatus Woesearchaeota archaeon CG11_big_fil_rev_8_21_14_0_20_57_5]